MNEVSALSLPPQRLPLRVSDVDMLHKRGAFADYGRVELIEGELLYMNAEYRPHMFVKSEFAYRVRRAVEALGSALFVGIEGSVALSDHDLPQPDIILTSAAHGEGPVPGASVALAIEVSDTTTDYDLGRKLRIYARGGIPEYWVLDLAERVIHQLATPTRVDFATRRHIPFGEPIAALTIPGLTVPTDRLRVPDA